MRKMKNKKHRIEKKAVVKIEPRNLNSAETLIAKAIDNKVPVETMERLLVMRRELKQEKAKESFDRDLANFQGECPVINRTKIVKNKDGSKRYAYAPLESIVEQTKKLFQKYGFSYTVDTQVDSNFVTAICTVTHEQGHCQTSRFKIPIQSDAYMTKPQTFAAALTFGKRYAFCNAFGILTGDEDNDAISTVMDTTKPPEIEKKELKPIQPNDIITFGKYSKDPTRKWKWGELPIDYLAWLYDNEIDENRKKQIKAIAEFIQARKLKSLQQTRNLSPAPAQTTKPPSLPTVSPQKSDLAKHHTIQIHTLLDRLRKFDSIFDDGWYRDLLKNEYKATSSKNLDEKNKLLLIANLSKMLNSEIEKSKK